MNLNNITQTKRNFNVVASYRGYFKLRVIMITCFIRTCFSCFFSIPVLGTQTDTGHVLQC